MKDATSSLTLTDTLVGPDAMHPWGIHTRGPFRHIELPGGHFFIRQQWARIGDEIRTKQGSYVGQQ